VALSLWTTCPPASEPCQNSKGRRRLHFPWLAFFWHAILGLTTGSWNWGNSLLLLCSNLYILSQPGRHHLCLACHHLLLVSWKFLLFEHHSILLCFFSAKLVATFCPLQLYNNIMLLDISLGLTMRL
jgi:hypothetical protein